MTKNDHLLVISDWQTVVDLDLTLLEEEYNREKNIVVVVI